MDEQKIRVQFEIPGGARVTIDSPRWFRDVPGPVAGDGLRKEAETGLATYVAWRRSKRKGRLPQQTTFSRAGVELPLIGCYMAGLTIDGTREYLKRRHGVIAARSPVGRAFRDFFELKFKRSAVPCNIDF